MHPDTIVDQLKSFLMTHGVMCGAGVTEDRIDDFETRYGIRFPLDIRDYFARLNGTAGDYGYGIMRFWSIDEVRTLAEEIYFASAGAAVIQGAITVPIEDASREFVFADCLHESQLYTIHLSPLRNDQNYISLFDGSTAVRVAHSFSEFIELYLNSPGSLRLVVD